MKYLDLFSNWNCPPSAPVQSPTSAPVTFCDTTKCTKCQSGMCQVYESTCSVPIMDNIVPLNNILTAAMVDALGAYGNGTNYIFDIAYGGPGYVPHVVDPQNATETSPPAIAAAPVPSGQADTSVYVKMEFFSSGSQYSTFMTALNQAIQTVPENVTFFIQKILVVNPALEPQYGEGYASILFIDTESINFNGIEYLTGDADTSFLMEAWQTLSKPTTAKQVIDCVATTPPPIPGIVFCNPVPDVTSTPQLFTNIYVDKTKSNINFKITVTIGSEGIINKSDDFFRLVANEYRLSLNNQYSGNFGIGFNEPTKGVSTYATGITSSSGDVIEIYGGIRMEGSDFYLTLNVNNTTNGNTYNSDTIYADYSFTNLDFHTPTLTFVGVGNQIASYTNMEWCGLQLVGVTYPPAAPTRSPTASPTTASPTMAPTASPTMAPTASPTNSPTVSPTHAPIVNPLNGLFNLRLTSNNDYLYRVSYGNQHGNAVKVYPDTMISTTSNGNPDISKLFYATTLPDGKIQIFNKADDSLPIHTTSNGGEYGLYFNDLSTAPLNTNASYTYNIQDRFELEYTTGSNFKLRVYPNPGCTTGYCNGLNSSAKYLKQDTSSSSNFTNGVIFKYGNTASEFAEFYLEPADDIYNYVYTNNTQFTCTGDLFGFLYPGDPRIFSTSSYKDSTNHLNAGIKEVTEKEVEDICDQYDECGGFTYFSSSQLGILFRNPTVSSSNPNADCNIKTTTTEPPTMSPTV